MTEATYNRLLQQLIKEISEHPYREELLQLMQEQSADDTFVLATSNVWPFFIYMIGSTSDGTGTACGVFM